MPKDGRDAERPADNRTVDRLIRVRRWDEALALLNANQDGGPDGGGADDVAFRRRRRWVAAMAGRLDVAIADAAWIAAQPAATAADWAHLAHVNIRDLRCEAALAAARVAIAQEPGLLRAWAVVLAAVAAQPALMNAAAAVIGLPPPSPLPVSAPPASAPPASVCSTLGAGAADTPARPVTVALPWRTPPYAAQSGPHPVIASVFEKSAAVTARWTDPARPPDPALAWGAAPDLIAWAARHPGDAARRALVEMLVHRLPMAFHPSPDADLIFHHTVPFSLGPFNPGAPGLPWVYHLEQINTLHAPIVGYPHAVIRFDAPWTALLGDLFRAPSCLGIVTHIRRTAERLRRLFPDPGIQAKLTYIPLGVGQPQAFRSRPDESGLSRRRPTAPAIRRARRTLLFTNSHGADNFFLRGGVDTLAAAETLARRRDDFHLLVRSPPPDMPSAAARMRWMRHPAVTWLADRLSETGIEDLYRQSDVFLLPSGILHAVSLTRALRHGMAVVASDADGVEEFIRHGVNGLVTPGRRAPTWRAAPGVLIDEDHRWMLNPAPTPVDGRFHRRFVAAIERLLDDRALETRLRRAAALGAARDHDERRWARAVSDWTRRAFLAGAQR